MIRQDTTHDSGQEHDLSVNTVSSVAGKEGESGIHTRTPWFLAFKRILPIYVVTHLAMLVLTYLSILFTVPDLSDQPTNISALWEAWRHWDTLHFISIAQHGYDVWWRTAFFPLYPFMMRILFLDPLFSGFLISNIAGLIMLVVLYRMVSEDFGAELAERSILYLSFFPSAFFLAAVYSESLFLCLICLSFYSIRHGYWFRAGICGFLACLTRSVGLIFVLPFLYEYLRQRNFRLKAIRPDILSVILLPTGVLLFSFYCYLSFGDPLSFSHAQSVMWKRSLQFPIEGWLLTLQHMSTFASFLSFSFIRNSLELTSSLFSLCLIMLGLFGPWRLPRQFLAYNIYALALFLYFHSFSTLTLQPLESITRYMLELFPNFIVLAIIGKKSRSIHLGYLVLSGSLLFFLLTQFLTGHWIT